MQTAGMGRLFLGESDAYFVGSMPMKLRKA